MAVNHEGCWRSDVTWAETDRDWRRLDGHRDDFLFSFLSSAQLPTVLVGALVTMVGGLVWVLRSQSAPLVAWGVLLIGASLVTFLVVPINVHGWSVALVFPIWCGMLIGSVCVVLPLVRRLWKALAGDFSRPE